MEKRILKKKEKSENKRKAPTPGNAVLLSPYLLQKVHRGKDPVREKKGEGESHLLCFSKAS